MGAREDSENQRDIQEIFDFFGAVGGFGMIFICESKHLFDAELVGKIRCPYCSSSGFINSQIIIDEIREKVMQENPTISGDAIQIFPIVSADTFSAQIWDDNGEVQKVYLFDAVGERVNV